MVNEIGLQSSSNHLPINCFIIFMNDMKLHDKVLTHKYIDDITLTDSISATNKGYLQEAVHTIKT